MEPFKTGALIRKGIVTLAILVLGFGGWASLTQISGAVIVAAVVDAGDQKRSLQHPQGGRITSIAFENGALVQAGDVIATLDSTMLTHERTIRQNQRHALMAQRDRFTVEAERNYTPLIFSPQLLATPEAARILEHEAKLYEAQRTLFVQGQTQLDQQIAQTQSQLVGLEAQMKAVSIQMQLQKDRFERQQALFEKGLVTSEALSAQAQNMAALEGNLARIRAARIETNLRIEQLRVEKAKAQTDRMQTAIANLAQTQLRLAALDEELASVQAALDQLAIRAPMKGVLHGLDPTAEGSVLQPGETLADILPQGSAAIAIAQLAPQYIDRVAVGQPVTLRFPDIDPRNAPESSGEIKLVSADAHLDKRTGMRYYRVEISIPDGPLHLQPGKTAEALLHTGSHTPLAYLTDPFLDYFRSAFREG